MPPAPSSRIRRFLGRLWRATLGRWVRRVDFWLLRRDLDQPGLELPPGRHSPLDDESGFFLEHATNAHLDLVAASVPPRKMALFRRWVSEPATDMMLRIGPDDRLWAYLITCWNDFEDPEYGFRIALTRGRDVWQYDGWVQPDLRGRLIGIAFLNEVLAQRRSEGFERIYDAVRKVDHRSEKIHRRFGFRRVGSIRHWQIGRWQFNRVQWDPGENPVAATRGGEGPGRFRSWPDAPGNRAPNRQFPES